jgi:hypothetical protein
MASEPAPAPGEFRPYRRFVSWFVLSFVSLGAAYLLLSVGLTIYRRRHAVPTGAPVGVVASPADLESCAEELTDVEQGLERHLENFRGLFDHYDHDEAQRWAEDRAFWLAQWKAAGDHCRFGEPRTGPLAKEWDALGVVHTDLRETEDSYTRELLRFGQNQAPRLDHIRERLETVNRRIGSASATTSPDSGEQSP